MIFINVSQDGSLTSVSRTRTNQFQIEAPDNQFVDYPQPCWVWDGAELTLKSDADTIRDAYLTNANAPTPPPRPKVSPVEFKLLFTSAERVKLKELRATDPILDDFWSIVDDPRATQIRLGLTSTQQGVAYAISLLVAAGVVDAADEASRVSEVLSGTLQ